jgi:uncharacterized protein
MQKFLNLKYLVLVCLSFLIHTGFAQNDDLKLMEQFETSEKKYPERKVVFIKPKKNNLFARINPLRYIFGSLLFGYQKVISPQIARQCGFEVSCSEFSKNCIQQYGLFKGIALSADRMSRCTRVSGFDLRVPDFNFKTKKIIDPVLFYAHKHTLDSND